jgi:hypothetical protein
MKPQGMKRLMLAALAASAQRYCSFWALAPRALIRMSMFRRCPISSETGARMSPTTMLMPRSRRALTAGPEADVGRVKTETSW